MDEVEEAKELINDFVRRNQFQNAESMVAYAEDIKGMHLEDECESCINKYQNSNLSDIPAVVSSSDVNESAKGRDIIPSFTGISSEKLPRGRKSRKSVCVPKLTYSSSETDDEAYKSCDNDEESDKCEDEVFFKDQTADELSSFMRRGDDKDDANKSDNEDIIKKISGLTVLDNVVVDTDTKGAPRFESTVLSQDIENADSDDSVVVTRKKKTRRLASSSDESDDNELKKIHRTLSVTSGEDGRKNSTSSVNSNNVDESDDDCGDGTKASRRIVIDSESSESDSESSSERRQDSFIVSDDEYDDDVDDDDDNDDDVVDYDDCVSGITRSIKKLNVVTVDSTDDSDFEHDTNSKKTEIRSNKKVPPVTPKLNNRKPLVEERKNVMTPKSSIRGILNSFPTPNSVPGTPAYKRHFNIRREKIVKDLFSLYNRTVFDNKLPDDFEITWNKRLTKTAGFCYLLRSGDDRKSRIELSDKVIDSIERIRDTLIHEMCHAATWIFEGKRGHGFEWKYWAKKANKAHPDLPVVTTCHSYDIKTKYNFQCDGCGHIFGRHSKSVDPTKHRCGNCGGTPLLLSGSSTTETPKLNAYASYVKENFSSVKKDNPALSAKDVMKKIAEDYRMHKKDPNNKENIACVT